MEDSLIAVKWRLWSGLTSSIVSAILFAIVTIWVFFNLKQEENKFMQALFKISID